VISAPYGRGRHLEALGGEGGGQILTPFCVKNVERLQEPIASGFVVAVVRGFGASATRVFASSARQRRLPGFATQPKQLQRCAAKEHKQQANVDRPEERRFRRSDERPVKR